MNDRLKTKLNAPIDDLVAEATPYLFGMLVEELSGEVNDKAIERCNDDTATNVVAAESLLEFCQVRAPLIPRSFD